MKAILLAAGLGRRLGRASPKCLVSIEGRTLLERHLSSLAEHQVRGVTIVVGYQREQIQEELSRLRPSIPVELVVNERYTRGNLLSLHVAADRLEGGGLWMDADVFYPPELLGRLLRSPHENCILLDPRVKETGEEMMAGVRDGRVARIARRIGEGWDVAGEAVGFTKVDPEGGRAMIRFLEEEVAAGRVDEVYEAAMDRALEEVFFGFERVDDLPWTEIDDEEDVERARRLASAMPR